MKGKRVFTANEVDNIRRLINQKVRASKNEQKRIRDEIRSIGFYFSDFSNKKGYTVDDFEMLIKTNEIEIVSTHNKGLATSCILPKLKTDNTKEGKFVIIALENRLIINAQYILVGEADSFIPKDRNGFYSIRLSNGCCLPKKYQIILDKRFHRIIYIGIAKGQYLYNRFRQELRADGHGTFFRSIGAVLGFLPPKGSLVEKMNQNNFKFSIEDETEIINWINANLEISWCDYDGDFSIEEELIIKYCPLLNGTHNPLSLKELREDKDKCRIYARGFC